MRYTFLLMYSDFRNSYVLFKHIKPKCGQLKVILSKNDL